MEIKAETRTKQSVKDSIKTIGVHAKRIEGSTEKLESVADKAKQFTNSEAMNWFLGFKV